MMLEVIVTQAERRSIKRQGIQIFSSTASVSFAMRMIISAARLAITETGSRIVVNC